MGRDVPSVRAANLMVGRVCVLLYLLQAKGVFWMLEQPVGSLLERHPAFQRIMGLPGCQMRRISTAMSWFGAPARKPTWVYASRFESNVEKVQGVKASKTSLLGLGHDQVDSINDYADKDLQPAGSQMVRALQGQAGTGRASAAERT